MPLLSIAQIARQITTRPTLAQVLMITALIWAAIYLPGLGSVELKHEEPRRAIESIDDRKQKEKAGQEYPRPAHSRRLRCQNIATS